MTYIRGLAIRAGYIAVAVLGLGATVGACADYAPVTSPFVQTQPQYWQAERDSPRTGLGSNRYEAEENNPPAIPARRDGDAFDGIARDLLLTIPAGLKIALQPYRAGEVPVALARAQSFNDALSRAIEAASSVPGVVVAREELPRLFAEAEEFGDSNATQKLLEAAKADVLVVGAMVPARGGVEISYKAFDSRNGRQLASAAPRFVAVDASAPSGMTLDQALAATADALLKQAPDMKSVETLGVYYQQSEIQTAFGGYIGRELAGRLVERVGGQAATPAALLRPALAQMEKLAPGGTEEAMLNARPGLYLLSGTIWDMGADVEVRMTLRGKSDKVASYGVRIRRDALPASFLPLAPTSTQNVAVRREALGPFALQLTSDRGRRPVYGIGDSAHLVVQSAQDGYLYCFHQASSSAGGSITRIFPNQYYNNATIRRDVSIHIPDDAMKFALDVQGPAGVEYVRCFVLDRDLGATLQGWNRDSDLGALNVASLDELGRLIRASPSAAVSEATLVMTIEAPRG